MEKAFLVEFETKRMLPTERLDDHGVDSGSLSPAQHQPL